MLHDAFAVRGPGIDAEGEMRSHCRHRFWSSKTQMAAVQAVVALAA
jgi:hypothetical protein